MHTRGDQCLPKEAIVERDAEAVKVSDRCDPHEAGPEEVVMVISWRGRSDPTDAACRS